LASYTGWDFFNRTDEPLPSLPHLTMPLGGKTVSLGQHSIWRKASQSLTAGAFHRSVSVTVSVSVSV